jgi:hypothetical protein
VVVVHCSGICYFVRSMHTINEICMQNHHYTLVVSTKVFCSVLLVLNCSCYLLSMCDGHAQELLESTMLASTAIEV